MLYFAEYNDPYGPKSYTVIEAPTKDAAFEKVKALLVPEKPGWILSYLKSEERWIHYDPANMVGSTRKTSASDAWMSGHPSLYVAQYELGQILKAH